MAGAQNNPPCRREDAMVVAMRLRDAGHVAYFAGGCVRDLLLGYEPADYDVATDAPPDRVRRLFPNTQSVGAAFGVILVRHHGSTIEVATFRADGRYSDGRHPDKVRFATAEEDAQRRDFTINGLFLDPVDDSVIDFVGGRADLAARRLRAIGEPARRFEEDHLRMLRGVRFAARFDFEIEKSTAEAIRHAAGRLKGISPERIAEELRLMLTPLTRPKAWQKLWELELAPVVFRLFSISRGLPIFSAIAPEEPISFSLALAAAVLEVTGQLQPPRAEIRKSVAAIRQSLRVSNEESEAMEGILEGLIPLLADQSPTLAQKKRFLAQPTSADSRRLLQALARLGQFVDRVRVLEPEFITLEQTDFAPLPLLTGDDLTAAGMNPGPMFKRILDSVYDAQLEGRIFTRLRAMEFVESTYGNELSLPAMKIPQNSIYAEEKFTKYLLVKRLVDDKSGFLEQAGFQLPSWSILRDSIRELANSTSCELDHTDEYGSYWRVEGELKGPAGRLAVALIFQERAFDGRFRFVTLLPQKRKRP